MMRPASAMSARSYRKAWTRGSSGREGPVRLKRSAVLKDEAAFPCRLSAGAVMLEIAFETFKEFLPSAGLGDEDVAAIGLVADAAQIAERAERVQGAGDDRLGHSQDVGESPYRVRARGQIDEQHQRHLPVGEIGLA